MRISFIPPGIPRGLVAIVFLLACTSGAGAQQRPATAPPATPPTQQPAPPVPAAENPASIEGFRTARFGMNETELRAAIRRDFPAPAERIVSEQTPVERTQVLTLAVPDLIPDAGTARISYILGHRSKRLIQVTILWGPPADPAARPDALANAAEALRAHFVSLSWRPGSVAGGIALADGSTLVFRGLDAEGRMAQLQVLPGPVAAPQAQRSFGLRLAYVADPLAPDVFRLQRGQF